MKKEYTVQNISIHTLRGEGDELDGAIVSITMDFNPHPPWGGRPKARGKSDDEILFQSTPSVGRATRTKRYNRIRSINFNPHPPWGGRRRQGDDTESAIDISIHTLRGEGDTDREDCYTDKEKFQSTPSVGRATIPIRKRGVESIYFNPHPPWGGRPSV